MRTAAQEQSSAAVRPVRATLDSYYRAWRIPESWIDDLSAEAEHAIDCALLRGETSDPHTIAIREAERVLAERLNPGAAATALDSDTRLALALSGTRLCWAGAETDLRAEVEELKRKAETLTEPDRPPELALDTMQTSLSRLPSIRMVAGWMLLVLALFLAFIFTRQP